MVRSIVASTFNDHSFSTTSHPMNYTVACHCGNEIGVSASQAGSSVSCDCGQAVDVPRLSLLRRSAGEEGVPLGIIERIELLIDKDRLELGESCVVSGVRTTSVLHFHVQCERIWQRGGSPGFFMLILQILIRIPFGRIGQAMWQDDADDPVEEFGRDSSIVVPLHVAPEYHQQVLGCRNQRKLKKMLRTVPIYDELLDEYPGAIISPTGQ